MKNIITNLEVYIMEKVSYGYLFLEQFIMLLLSYNIFLSSL